MIFSVWYFLWNPVYKQTVKYIYWGITICINNNILLWKMIQKNVWMHSSENEWQEYQTNEYSYSVKYLNILHTVAMMHPVHIFRLFSTRIQVTGHQLPQVTWGHSWGKKWQPDCENQKKFSSQKDVKKLASPFDLKDYVLFLFFLFEVQTRLWVKASKNKFSNRPDNSSYLVLSVNAFTSLLVGLIHALTRLETLGRSTLRWIGILKTMLLILYLHLYL